MSRDEQVKELSQRIRTQLDIAYSRGRAEGKAEGIAKEASEHVPWQVMIGTGCVIGAVATQVIQRLWQ